MCREFYVINLSFLLLIYIYYFNLFINLFSEVLYLFLEISF